MSDATLENLKVAKAWGMTPAQVLEMPNYLFLDCVEFDEIQTQIDWLHREELKARHGNNY